MKPEVVCVGIVTLDQVFSVPSIRGGADKVVATALARHAGGMAATSAAAIAALGGNVQFWGRVGQDDAGALLAESLRDAGVDIRGLLRCASGITPTSAVLKSADGERLIAAFPGGGFCVEPARLPLEDIDAETVVLSDLRWPDAGIAAFETARSRGAPTVLDADVGAVDATVALGSLADHIIFSQPGLAAFGGTPDMREALRRARQSFKASLSVTLGADGVLWLDGENDAVLPAPGIQALDTTGAGDVFHGAFALALARGRAFERCLTFASSAAAAKCLNGTGWKALPDARQASDIETATYGRRDNG